MSEKKSFGVGWFKEVSKNFVRNLAPLPSATGYLLWCEWLGFAEGS